MTRFRCFAAAGHVLLMVALVAGLIAARQATLSTFSSPTAQRDWQQWRDAAGAQGKTPGPVQRKVPTSTEPPALRLLRDYFITCVVTTLVLSSALYWTFAILIRGVMYGPRFEIGRDETK